MINDKLPFFFLKHLVAELTFVIISKMTIS